VQGTTRGLYCDFLWKTVPQTVPFRCREFPILCHADEGPPSWPAQITEIRQALLGVKCLTTVSLVRLGGVPINYLPDYGRVANTASDRDSGGRRLQAQPHCMTCGQESVRTTPDL